MILVNATARDGDFTTNAARLYGSPLFATIFTFVVLITLDTAGYTLGGTPLFVVLALTSAFSWGMAVRAIARRPRSQPAAFNLYITALVGLMVMYAEQWAGDWSSRVMFNFPRSFPTGVGISNHDFITVFPLAGAALLLFGALAYYHGNPLGRFAAWFIFTWGVLASLSTYVLPLFSGEPFHPLPGAFTAPFPLIVSVMGLRRLLQEGVRSDDMKASGDTRRTIRWSVALVAIFIPAYATLLYSQAGLLVVGIVGGSMVAGFVIWLRTTLWRPPAPNAVLPAYLLALAFFLVHVTEEYTFDFAGRIAGAAHVAWTQAQFVEVIVLLGPAIWIAGIIGIYRRHPLGNFIVWFFFVGMILGEPAHLLVFPFLEGGRYHYFPGMWSALLPLAPAAYGIRRLLADGEEDTRHSQEMVSS